MKARKELEQIILDCFREVYRNTTPAVNLDVLIETGEAKIDDWFMDYTISEELFEKIMKSYIDRYKLSGWEERAFKTNMYLGPSPKFTPKNSSQDPPSS